MECSIFTFVSFFSCEIQVFFLTNQCDIILNTSHVQIKICMQYSVIRHLKAQILLVFGYILSALYVPALELDVLRPGVHVQVREEEVLLCQYLLPALHHLQAIDALLLDPQQHRPANRSTETRHIYIDLFCGLFYKLQLCKCSFLLCIHRFCVKKD